VPFDAKLAAAAARSGKPLSSVAGNTKVGGELRLLVERLSGREAAKAKSGLRRWFG
jgi:Flp pilus assembly CpaE family ATPase